MKNGDGNTPLHWACLNGHKAAVERLMGRGASAAVLNAAGRTPLDEALSSGAPGMLELIKSYDVAGSSDIEMTEEDMDALEEEGEDEEEEEEGAQGGGEGGRGGASGSGGGGGAGAEHLAAAAADLKLQSKHG